MVIDPEMPLTKINPANSEEKVFWDRAFLSMLPASGNVYVAAQAADVAIQARRKRLEHP